MFLNNGRLVIETLDFGNSTKGVEKHSHEKNGASGEKVGSGVECAIEGGTDNKSHD